MALPQRKPGSAEAKKAAKAKSKADAQKRANDEALAKREAEEPQEPSRLDGPRVDGDERYFTRGDRLELLLLQERLQHAQSRHEKAKADLARHEAAYLHQRDKFAATQSAAGIAIADHKARLLELHEEIQRVYGVSIEGLVLDDETGLITQTTH